MRNPRICYVNPPVLLKRPISELIDKFTQRGYKTSLLIPKKLFKKRDASLHHSTLVRRSRVYTYSIINPPFISQEQPVPVTPMFCINTFKALKNHDIIHMWVPYYFTSFWIILTKRLFFPKKKLILTMDTVPGYSFSMGQFWNVIFRIYNWLFRWLLFGTPKIITLYGKSMLPYALKAGAPRQKIKIIPTGIDITKYSHKTKSKPGIRKELKIKPKTKIILFVGLLVPRKGVDKVIKIAHKMKRQDFVFMLAGNGPKRKKYEKQVRKLKLEKRVLFLGWRMDMHKLYQASNVLLLPAEGEGLPGVIMEAMTYGLPCVASDIPCIPDLIENGKNGFLCPKNNINAFVKALSELMKNKNKREKISKQSIKKIKEFDWKKILKKYEQIYMVVQR